MLTLEGVLVALLVWLLLSMVAGVLVGTAAKRLRGRENEKGALVLFKERRSCYKRNENHGQDEGEPEGRLGSKEVGRDGDT